MTKIYLSKKNGQEAELVAKNEHGVILKILETGEEKIIAETTLKRWWIAAEGIQAQGRPEEVEETKEVIEEEPQKEEKKKPAISEETASLLHENIKLFLQNMIEEKGITVSESEKVKGFLSLKINGKIFMAMTLSKRNGIRLWLRAKAIEGLCEYQKAHHAFDARVVIPDWSLDSYNLLVTLHNASLNYQLNKKAKK